MTAGVTRHGPPDSPGHHTPTEGPDSYGTLTNSGEGYRRLYRLAHDLSWYGTTDVDDLVQEAALRLWRLNLDGWNGLTYVVAKRTMIDWLRQKYGRRYQRRFEQLPEAWQTDDTCPDAARDFERAEARVVATQIRWRRLSGRQLLMLERRAGGATLREIGDELGITEQAVCIALRRSRDKLLADVPGDER